MKRSNVKTAYFFVGKSDFSDFSNKTKTFLISMESGIFYRIFSIKSYLFLSEMLSLYLALSFSIFKIFYLFIFIFLEVLSRNFLSNNGRENLQALKGNSFFLFMFLCFIYALFFILLNQTANLP